MEARRPTSSPYPVDLGFRDVRTGMYDEFTWDDAGVPMYPYTSGSEYNVTFVCHFALYHLGLFQRYGRQGSRDRFLDLARWLAEHGAETGDSFVFHYTHRVPGVEPPWVSALGQGRMISVFTRAFEESNERHYLDLAEKCLHPFTKAVAEGGVRAPFPDGGVGFEEYPTGRPSLVLNGMITALIGLHDLARLGSDRAAVLFRDAIDALERNVARYDLGYGSAYDLARPFRRVANRDYHGYHVMLLWVLHEITGRETFREFAVRWGALRLGTRWFVRRGLSRIGRGTLGLFRRAG